MNKIKEILRANDLRPTKQRVLIGDYLFDGIDKHVTAESLFKKLSNEKRGVSLATVYNTLHEFCKKELLNKITIDTETNALDIHVSEEELESRRKQWSKPEPNYKTGALAKYATLVGSAANGAITSANP